jgi:branched-subunit amino acid ABC-type transport system permease component
MSQARHHAKTGNVSRDEVFVPVVREEVDETPHWHQTPLYRLYCIVGTLVSVAILVLLFSRTSF